VTETGRVAKDGDGDYTMMITALVKPGDYYTLEEWDPDITIEKWVEYKIA